MTLFLHPNAATTKNGFTLEEKTTMIGRFENARDLISEHLQSNDHPLIPVDLQDISNEE